MTKYPELASRSLSAEVIRADWSRSTFARCDVDKENDTLVITTIDEPQRVMARFPPGTWRYGHAYGADGYPIYSFASHLEGGTA